MEDPECGGVGASGPFDLGESGNTPPSGPKKREGKKEQETQTKLEQKTGGKFRHRCFSMV